MPTRREVTDLVTQWFDENLMKVQLSNYHASNYILADLIEDELDIPVTPDIVHEVALALGYIPERRHLRCYAYNAKFRVTPKSETILLEDFDSLPKRHPPVLAFIQIGASGPFYVQMTTNIRGRMEDLNTYNPYNIYLRGVMRGGFVRGAEVLESLEPHLLKKGWYEPAVELLKFIYQSGEVENSL